MEIKGQVELDIGINFNEVVKTTEMVDVGVREHGKVNGAQIEAQFVNVALKDIGIVARVKQNAFAVVLHQSAVAPVLFQLAAVAEGIVEVGDPIFASGGQARQCPRGMH
jgi:hypothetical protein